VKTKCEWPETTFITSLKACCTSSA